MKRFKILLALILLWNAPMFAQSGVEVSAPVFNPPAGVVEPYTIVEITSATEGAKLAYVKFKAGEAEKTIDLSDPNTYSIYKPYSLWLEGTEGAVTFKAVAFLEDNGTITGQSEVVTAHYTFAKVAAPKISPRGGKVEYGTLVSISGSGDIYYTTDGSEPTTESKKYSGPISLDRGFDYGQSVTVKAIAVADGERSNVAEETYIIKRPAELTANPERSTVLKGETVVFDLVLDPKDYKGSSMLLGMQIDGYEALTSWKFRRKTETEWTDLTDEIKQNEGTISRSMPYNADAITWEYAVGIAAETDIEKMGFVIGFSAGSDRPFCGLQAQWTLIELPAPVFSQPSGTVAKNTAITLQTTEPEAEIRYTTDGSEPTAESTKYENPVQITTFTTLKAVTVRYGMCSKVAEAIYTLVETPEFSVPSGVVERNSTVTLTTATAGAKIHYTTDGTAPSSASTEYTGAIQIDRSMTIKAIAVLDGERSLVSEVIYTLVKAPEFSIAAGKVTQNAELTLTADGAKIYYTMDGTEPTVSATEYTQPIVLSKKMTVKAIAIAGDEMSLVAEAAYVVIPIAPTFSIPAGAVESGTTVALTAVGDAEIRFSAMGSVTASSTLYKNPIKITSEKTISAAAFLDGEMSDIVTAKYTLKVDEPVFTPASGAVEKGTKVTIEAGRASIRYTTDGSEPTDKNGRWYNPNAGVVIDSAMTVKAYAVQGSTQSRVVTAVYWLVGEEPAITEVAMPTFSVPAGEVEKGTKVEMACATEGAKIYYTVDGSEPSAQSTEYKAAVAVNEALTLKAIAILGDIESEVASAAYTVKGEEAPAVEVAMPTFSVPAGEVEKGTKVAIACATEDAKIYYTVDGGEPTAQSTEYKEAVAIDKDLTLKAIAILGEDKSEVASAAYTVKGDDEPGVSDTVAVPTFSVPAGEVEKGTKVEIACTTEDAKIYYTVDGSEPTAQSAEYKEAIVINEALTLKAIAILGDIESEVASAAYTIKDVANEELELAGVSVYPNPSNGVFNLELPVSATVEVFASTGVLRQRVEAGAGVVTLNIERSGIYFLRITGEGRTTVKRVVVR